MAAYSKGSILIFKVLTEKLPITIFTDNEISEDKFTNQRIKLFDFVVEHPERLHGKSS